MREHVVFHALMGMALCLEAQQLQARLQACLEVVIFLFDSLWKSSMSEASSLRPDSKDLVVCLEVLTFLFDSL